MMTAINTRYAAWKNRVKLTNEEREMLYDFFSTTDKKILEAVLKKKDKKPKKHSSKKSYGKGNPLWREDEYMKSHMASLK